MPDAIEVQNLSFSYATSKAKALDNLSINVEQGDFLGIIGPSSSGKSTLIYALNGVIPHYYQGDFYGHVRVMGDDTFAVSLTDISRKLGSVFQDTESQMVASIVEDEILFGLENFSVPAIEIEQRLTEALDFVGIKDLRHRAIATLSGGQRQKVTVAAALALKPRILLLDEPTGELDPASSTMVYELLVRLNRELGMTIIVVEQKIMLLCTYAKSLAVISDGRLAFKGSVPEVLEHSREMETLGVNCPRVTTLARELKDAGMSELPIFRDVEQAVSALAGATFGRLSTHERLQSEQASNARPYEGHEQPVFAPTSAKIANTSTAIKFEHVDYRYDGGKDIEADSQVLRDVSFEIATGEFVAIIGTNGAGKSTATKLMNGLLKPSSGKVYFDGTDVASIKTSQIARSVSMLFQNPDRQICKNTVREELEFSLKFADITAEERTLRVQELIDLFGFDGEKAPFSLSRGDRQLVALASALAARPRVLILDEPTNGLDYRECMQVMVMVEELHAAGTTVVMVSHDMEVVYDFCQRIIVMSEGSVVLTGNPDEVFRNSEAMQAASIKPPQIIELALLLGEPYAALSTIETLRDKLLEQADR